MKYLKYLKLLFSLYLIIFLNSCYYASPGRELEMKLKNEGKVEVSFLRLEDGVSKYKQLGHGIFELSNRKPQIFIYESNLQNLRFVPIEKGQDRLTDVVYYQADGLKKNLGKAVFQISDSGRYFVICK